ncbi:uncharacterized protein LOC134956784 isoform X2 [Pseudophryne corroboree]|uniref:uncharacterized protein LOC134956784 isoform X2 n=1 Tax=Pseudophryne corroboree TaxID=495146 RepID=UPI0030814BBD
MLALLVQQVTRVQLMYVTSPGCITPTADGCAITTMTESADFLNALSAFLCAAPDIAGNAFSYQKFLELYEELKKVAGCAGCDVNVLLGTDLDLENLTKDIQPTAEELIAAVNQLSGNLQLSKEIRKTLCTVVTTVNSECIQSLLKKSLPDAESDLGQLICQVQSSNPDIQIIAKLLGKLCGVTIDVDSLTGADKAAIVGLINSSLVNGLAGAAGGLVDNLTNGGLCKALGSGTGETGAVPGLVSGK